jgi:CO/xanthine dehydrogenase FAD-binding subunit
VSLPGPVFEFARPTDLQVALRLLALPGARALAGGTDVYPALTGVKAGGFPGDAGSQLSGLFVDITRVAGARGITRHSGGIRIGGATTWSDLVAADLPPSFDALRAAAREIGAVQIQNRGTIAGNLCNASPAADGMPPLLILNADVELVSLRGSRRMALAAFVTGNRRTRRADDELLVAIHIPDVSLEAQSTFLKLGARRYMVISIAMVAVLIVCNGDGLVAEARVAVGACSAVATRLPLVEAQLSGRMALSGLGRDLTQDHLAGLCPIDDIRATAAYRRDAVLTLVRRALDVCVQGNAGGVI